MFCDIIRAEIADNSAKIPEAAERIPLLLDVLELAEKTDAEKTCVSLRSLAVNGNDLKSFVPPSAVMGEILSQLLEEVIDGKIENEKRVLLKRAREIFDSKK